MSKTIGILGGMGPLATADLFRKIILLTESNCDQEHLHILIDNNTEIPDRTDYIINNGKNPESYLIKSAIKLELMGADVIIMPCNTAHYFYDTIIKYISIPFLSMIEETAKEVKRVYPSAKRVGLLATEGTCKAGIYDRVFQQYDIEVIKPDEENQQYVMSLIYDIKKGKTSVDLVGISKALSQLKSRNVDTLILGCTELPVAFQMFSINEDYIDPTEVIACSAIRFAGKNTTKDLHAKDILTADGIYQ